MINALQLTKLKDKLWYVAPSVATEGTGIFEGLVSIAFCHYNLSALLLTFAGLALQQRQDSPSEINTYQRTDIQSTFSFLFFGFTFVLMTRRSIWTFVSFLFFSEHFIFRSTSFIFDDIPSVITRPYITT